MKTSELYIPVADNIILRGSLSIPYDPNALVIFSHGSESSRFSPRNQYVAKILNKNNIAALLIDLLTETEDQVYSNRFDMLEEPGKLDEVANLATEWFNKFLVFSPT